MERERSEEHTSELQSRLHLVCRLLLEKKKKHDICTPSLLSFFFFNDTATTEIYTLSLHDALPISPLRLEPRPHRFVLDVVLREQGAVALDPLPEPLHALRIARPEVAHRVHDGTREIGRAHV